MMIKMRNDVILELSKNPDYFIYLRENPHWHRFLTFNPKLLKNFFEEYKIKRRKRMIDKIEDISTMLSIAKELL